MAENLGPQKYMVEVKIIEKELYRIYFTDLTFETAFQSAMKFIENNKNKDSIEKITLFKRTDNPFLKSQWMEINI